MFWEFNVFSFGIWWNIYLIFWSLFLFSYCTGECELYVWWYEVICGLCLGIFGPLSDCGGLSPLGKMKAIRKNEGKVAILVEDIEFFIYLVSLVLVFIVWLWLLEYDFATFAPRSNFLSLVDSVALGLYSIYICITAHRKHTDGLSSKTNWVSVSFFLTTIYTSRILFNCYQSDLLGVLIVDMLRHFCLSGKIICHCCGQLENTFIIISNSDITKFDSFN